MGIIVGLQKVVEYLTSNPLILVGLFLAYLVIYFISWMFFGEKKGKNPFDKDYRRASEPFVHDAKERDAVIKQRFKPSKVPADLDVIVIGSGVGGLTSGALLSRVGKKVLVLEQHDQAGGCCHSFVEKGFEFDTGVHYVGDLHDHSDSRTLLDSITNGQLRWAKLDDEFDTVALGDPSSAKLYPMKSGKERYFQNLIDMFPNEKEAILKYKDLVLDAASSVIDVIILKVLPQRLVKLLVVTRLYKILFKSYRKGYSSKTLQSVLDELTDNKDLKAVLAYICGDYGVLPVEAPFVLHSLLIKHYMNGAYYPVAGSSEIAFHMTQTIQDCDGRVLVQAPVTEIVCNDQGKAIGVTVGGKEAVTLYAKHIISDAGVVNTFKTLLPPEVAKKSMIYPLIDKVGPSCSFITAFIGVDGDKDELKLPAGNTWAFSSNDINQTMGAYLKLSPDELEDHQVPLLYISFPSAKDPEWSNKYPGKSTVEVITLASWEWFKEWKNDKLRHRGDRYEGIKDVIGRDMWKSCVELFPQLDGRMVYMEVGTPVTNQHYLASQQGEMYGLDQGKTRYDIDVVTKLRPETDIPGLYLTGQDTMTCGFGAATMMGMVTASQILNRNLYLDLRKLRKNNKLKDQKVETHDDKKNL